MPVMLERWNDDKMDALAAKVDGIEAQLLELQRDTKAGFERLDDRFDRMQRAAIQAAVGLASSMILGFATVIAAVLLGA
jgi:hypothetical protein